MLHGIFRFKGFSPRLCVSVVDVLSGWLKTTTLAHLNQKPEIPATSDLSNGHP